MKAAFTSTTTPCLGDDILQHDARVTMVECNESYDTGATRYSCLYSVGHSRCSETVQWLIAPKLSTLLWSPSPGIVRELPKG